MFTPNCVVFFGFLSTRDYGILYLKKMAPCILNDKVFFVYMCLAMFTNIKIYFIPLNTGDISAT